MPSAGPALNSTTADGQKEILSEALSQPPSEEPSRIPSKAPSLSPSQSPSTSPSTTPSAASSISPSTSPSISPSSAPSVSSLPSLLPSVNPSLSTKPSSLCSESPTQPLDPSAHPAASTVPSHVLSLQPSMSSEPSFSPSQRPSSSDNPSGGPSSFPSRSTMPSRLPTRIPSISLTPSHGPSSPPSESAAPSLLPTCSPSMSLIPSRVLSSQPSKSITPSNNPSVLPSKHPTESPSESPSSCNGPDWRCCNPSDQFTIQHSDPAVMSQCPQSGSTDGAGFVREEHNQDGNLRLTVPCCSGGTLKLLFGCDADFATAPNLLVNLSGMTAPRPGTALCVPRAFENTNGLEHDVPALCSDVGTVNVAEITGVPAGVPLFFKEDFAAQCSPSMTPSAMPSSCYGGSWQCADGSEEFTTVETPSANPQCPEGQTTGTPHVRQQFDQETVARLSVPCCATGELEVLRGCGDLPSIVFDLNPEMGDGSRQLLEFIDPATPTRFILLTSCSDAEAALGQKEIAVIDGVPAETPIFCREDFVEDCPTVCPEFQCYSPTTTLDEFYFSVSQGPPVYPATCDVADETENAQLVRVEYDEQVGINLDLLCCSTGILQVFRGCEMTPFLSQGYGPNMPGFGSTDCGGIKDVTIRSDFLFFALEPDEPILVSNLVSAFGTCPTQCPTSPDVIALPEFNRPLFGYLCNVLMVDPPVTTNSPQICSRIIDSCHCEMRRLVVSSDQDVTILIHEEIQVQVVEEIDGTFVPGVGECIVDSVGDVTFRAAAGVEYLVRFILVAC